MITCTFIGSRQYDLDLYAKIRAAVGEVVAAGDEIEFLFYRRSEEFYYLCFFAVLQAKHAFPDKKIVMTLVVCQGDEAAPWIEHRLLPRWSFDKIMPVLLDKASSSAPWERIERYMVRRSNYVIASCYPDLRWGQDRLFRYAVRRRDACVMNLISEETAAFIREAAAALPDPVRGIVEQVNNGGACTALAKAAGVSAETIRAKDGRGRRCLVRQAARRLEQARMNRTPQGPGICSVILPKRAPYETAERFHQMANLLIDHMGVSVFMTEQSNCPSDCMERFRNRQDISRIAVTHETAREGLDWAALREKYIPPCTQIFNIDMEVKTEWARHLRGVREMVSRSQFVICDLSEKGAVYSRIRRCMEKQRELTVLDLGHTPFTSDPQALL